MSVGLGSELKRDFLFFISLLIIIFACTVIIKSNLKKLEKGGLTAKKHLIRILSPNVFSISSSLFLVIFLYFYCFNPNINLKINSKLFSDSYCIVKFFYKYNDDYEAVIYLPPNSVYCYKTPDMIYYNNNSIDKCVKSLENNLKEEKKEGKIIDFNYSNDKFTIDCGNHRTIYIDFKTADDKTYFTVSYFEDQN